MSTPSVSRLGRRLVEKGWRLGVLIPPQPHAIVYDPRNPQTATAKALSADLRSSVEMKDGSERYIGIVKPKPGEFQVVTSQTCDIAASEEVEPYVELTRAYFTNNPRVIEEARASVRRFLLDPSRGLIVDAASPRSYVEKAALERYSPEVGAQSEEMERDFAQWLSRRVKRVALPDEFVDHVLEPMRGWLEVELAGDSGLSPYRKLLGMRMMRLRSQTPPYAVHLIALLGPDVEPGSKQADEMQVDLVEFFAKMRQALRSEGLSDLTFRARRLAELSSLDYVNSFELELW